MIVINLTQATHKRFFGTKQRFDELGPTYLGFKFTDFIVLYTSRLLVGYVSHIFNQRMSAHGASFVLRRANGCGEISLNSILPYVQLQIEWAFLPYSDTSVSAQRNQL